MHGGQKTVFPDNNIIKFDNVARQLKAPFVVYADFESILEAVAIDTAKTSKYQHHRACSYMYHIVCSVPGVPDFEPRLYVGDDAAAHMLLSLTKDLNDSIRPVIEREPVEMVYDGAAREKFLAATHCHICDGLLVADGDEDTVTVRDHCHFTGAFRGAAHQLCNLQYAINKDRYKLPIFFHNLRGYDAHLIMQAVKTEYVPSIDVIANNFERYITFSTGRLKFIDSMQFLAASLATLAGNLKKDDFTHLRRIFPLAQQADLLTRKGIYPYDHMDSMARFEETRLPSKEQFYTF